MKAQSTQQEILLITGTRFSEREWAEKIVEDKNKLSAIEKLEDACWNGLLDEMLPEIVQKAEDGKKLFLWNVRNCKSFLEIELSDSSPVIERENSIDPYLFVSEIPLN
ncbi:MAG: hypothetical protein JWO92_445 [Chitinophagaceae bacterium]|nr:hypothetical protein [Chitinophagaceae bacterium]MDB5222447.1 hypothetical protein [Chitinophagaceae bacterium]